MTFSFDDGPTAEPLQLPTVPVQPQPDALPTEEFVMLTRLQTDAGTNPAGEP